MRQPTPTSRGRGFSGRGASGRGFGRGASGREEAIPDELVGNSFMLVFYRFKKSLLQKSVPIRMRVKEKSYAS